MEMHGRMTFRDPDIAAFRARLAARAEAGGAGGSLEEQRAVADALGSAMPLPERTSVEPVSLGGVPGARFRTPAAEAGRALLYLHGGGYLTGSSRSHGAFVAHLSRAMSADGVALDYRCAPEAVFPAAVEDSVSAYAALLENGAAPDRVAIAGDSAGGGLTIATALALKGRGLPQPGALLAISPWVDLEQSGESYAGRCAERDPMITKAGLNAAAATYLGGASARDPLASPIHGDLTGLAPIYILCGGDEALLSDSLKLAEVAALAGVEVRLEVWPEMIHVWPVFHAYLGAGRRALAEAGRWLRERTG